MALWKVYMTDDETVTIEDERDLESLAGALTAAGNLLTTKVRMAQRQMVDGKPVLIMAAYIMRIEPYSEAPREASPTEAR